MNEPDIMQSCRLCMGPEQNINLFSEFQNSVLYAEVASSLMLIVLKDDPGLPSMICMECTSKLILFQKFRMKCIETNTRFNKSVKVPPTLDTPSECLLDETNVENHEMYDEDKHCAEYLLETTPLPEDCSLETSRDVEDENVDTALEYYTDNEEYLEESSFVALYYSDDNNSEIHEDLVYLDASDTDEQPSRESTTHPLASPNQPETNQPPPGHPKLSKKPTIIVCDDCGQQFSRKTSLDQHRKTLHLGLKEFTCDMCSQHFTRKSHLLCHMRLHRNDLPIVCPDCPKRFVKLSHMVRHRVIHSSARRYACKECPKRFKRSGDVVTHMLTHTKLKPFRCAGAPDCDKSYTSHSSLKKHVLKMHPPRSRRRDGEDGL